MPRFSHVAVALFVALPVALGACKKKPPVVAARDTTPPPRQVVDTPRATTPPERPPVAKTQEQIDAEVRALVLETVYFDYDTDAITAQSQSILEKKLPALQANPGLRFRIEGHCDDRGSDEYNIALGRRRAEAVKRFLTDRGIDASRIETVSFGRERPAMQGESEEARARNRRDEFTITAGGNNLKLP